MRLALRVLPLQETKQEATHAVELFICGFALTRAPALLLAVTMQASML